MAFAAQSSVGGLIRWLLTGWLAVTLVFLALRVLPGDAIETQLRITGTSTADIARRRTALGLDDPLWVQYGRYWLALGQGDLGNSLITREPVREMIAVRLPSTLLLALTALSIAVTGGVMTGTLATIRSSQENRSWLLRPLEIFSSGIMALALAMPVYWSATLLIFLLSNQLAWLPAGGNEGLASLILPALVLGFSTSGAIARVTQTALRSLADQPFVQTARAKGLPPDLVFEHLFRAALPPILSITGLQAGFLLSGTLIVEVIFTRRGLGSLMVQSVLNQDYPVVQGSVLLSAFSYALTRGLANWARRWSDPRLR